MLWKSVSIGGGGKVINTCSKIWTEMTRVIGGDIIHPEFIFFSLQAVQRTQNSLIKMSLIHLIVCLEPHNSLCVECISFESITLKKKRPCRECLLYTTQVQCLSPEMLELRLHFSLACEWMSYSTPASQSRLGGHIIVANLPLLNWVWLVLQQEAPPNSCVSSEFYFGRKMGYNKHKRLWIIPVVHLVQLLVSHNGQRVAL